MSYVLAFLRWLFGLFVSETKAAGAAEERERTDVANEAHLARQDEVANRPVSDEQLQKSLRDGTF